MKRAYPVFIAENENDFLVYVPDMDIYTEGENFIDAIEMARDSIGLKGIGIEDDGNVIPMPSGKDEAIKKAENDTEIFDYSKGILTFVDIDFSTYRKRNDNKMIRRNVTIPNWLNEKAEKEHLNVSKVLREALQEILEK